MPDLLPVQETCPHEPTPAQLLRILESERAQLRARRQSPRNRATFLIFSLLFIVLAASAALFVLTQMLSEHEPSQKARAAELRGDY